jgi:hypothetical protein
MSVYGAAIPSEREHTTKNQVELMSILKFQQRRVQAMARYHQVTTSRLDIQINAVRIEPW